MARACPPFVVVTLVVLCGCGSVPVAPERQPLSEDERLEVRRLLPAHLEAVGRHATRMTGCDGLSLQPKGIGLVHGDDGSQRRAILIAAVGCGAASQYISTCPPLPGLGVQTAPKGKILCRVQRQGHGEQSTLGTVLTDLGADYVVDEPDGTELLSSSPDLSPLPEPLHPYADDE